VAEGAGPALHRARKHCNLLAHAPRSQAQGVRAQMAAAVVASLEEAGAELFTFLRFPAEQWRSLRTTDEMDKRFLRCRGMILRARATSWRRAASCLC
jgi:transposase-like protein